MDSRRDKTINNEDGGGGGGAAGSAGGFCSSDKPDQLQPADKTKDATESSARDGGGGGGAAGSAGAFFNAVPGYKP